MLTRYSRRSIQRLVNRLLSLQDAPFLYHNVLTFRPQIFCEKEAKRLLDALLSNLHHRYDMGSLHVRHYHRNNAIHYHVLFLFFDKLPFAPSRMKPEFGTRVFKAWNKLQGGGLIRRANTITEHTNKLDALRYLLRRVRIAKGPTKTNHWWTYRNGRLIREKGVPVSLADRKAAFDYVLPFRPYRQRRSATITASDTANEVSFKVKFDAFLGLNQERAAFDPPGMTTKMKEAPIISDDPFADDSLQASSF